MSEQSTPAGQPHSEDNPSEHLPCLIWRCRACGAAHLGGIGQKPAKCDDCGAIDFDYVEED